jgi:hypothetical protein
LSYHFERARAKEHNLGNEFNPGLGVRYRTALNQSFDGFADAGVYYDSGRNTAAVAGAGLFRKASEGLCPGGGLASVTFNVAYAPRLGNVNMVNVLDFWLTFFPDK